MKRRREGLEKGSEIRSAIQELSLVKADQGQLISTKSFLNVCNLLLLQFLDKIGPTMMVLRKDVHQNIQRLEELYESDPLSYCNMVKILKREVDQGIARKVTSCSKALVWLTRTMDFAVAFLEKLEKDLGQSIEEVVEESYSTTLKPWHGWISSAAYKVALKLVPENKAFIRLLLAEEEECSKLKEEIQSLVSLLLPVLNEIHSVLGTFSLDRMKSI